MYTCKNCGSDRVQRAHWVMMNTREIHEPFIVAHNTWCIDCESHAEVVDDLIRVKDTKPESKAIALLNDVIKVLIEEDGEVSFASFLDGVRDAFYTDKKNNPYKEGIGNGVLHDAYEAGFEVCQDWMGNNPAK